MFREWNEMRPPVTPAPLRNFHPVLGQGMLVRPRTALTREFELQEEIVDKTDSRQQVDATRVPFRWICSLKVRFSDPDSYKVLDFDSGTGLLISPQHVLTAAHVVYNEIKGSKGNIVKRQALSVWAYPGRIGERDFPFGKAESESIAYLPKFPSNLDVQWDYALIKLKSAIGYKRFRGLGDEPLGYWGSGVSGATTRIQPLSRALLKGQFVSVCGYPKTKNHTQWLARDAIKDVTPTVNGKPVNELISYLVHTSQGQSGAPVWLQLPGSFTRFLVAIHGGSCIDAMDGCRTTPNGPPTSNRGVLITQEVVNQIEAWKKTM